MARICSKVLILLLLSLFILFSVSGCSEYSFKKVWEIKVLDSTDEENVFPMKVIPDTENNRIYANYASKLLCIDVSKGSRIWELDADKDKAIFEFIFSGSDFFISLIPKQYPNDKPFSPSIAKVEIQTGKILWNKEFSKSYSPIFLFLILEKELMIAREGKCYVLNCFNGEIMNEYHFPQVSYKEAGASSWTISERVFYEYLPVSKEIIRAKLPDFSNFGENLRFKNIVLPDNLGLSLVRDGKILLTSSNHLILGNENGEILKNMKFEDISTVEFLHYFINLNNNYINPTIYKNYIFGNYFSTEKMKVESGFLIADFENGTYIKKKIEEVKLGEIAAKAKSSLFIWKDVLFLIYEDKMKDRSTLLAYSFPDLELLSTISENTKFLEKRTLDDTDFPDPPYLFANMETSNITGLIVSYSDRIIFYAMNSK